MHTSIQPCRKTEQGVENLQNGRRTYMSRYMSFKTIELHFTKPYFTQRGLLRVFFK